MTLSLVQTLLQKMLLIRKFEERLLELFDEGVLVGTTHCYIGQEANAVGLISHLRPTDTVWSNHRCHGHYLAFQNDPKGLMAELMGKSTGVVGGRGGSQHLCRSNFFSNGVQGGITSAATGMAFAEKYRKTENIVTVFIGDGTLGEGLVYEAFNIASLWQLPILFVIENNRYAQSTPFEKQIAGTIKARPEAFGIQTTELSSFDVRHIHEAAGPVVSRVRQERKPQALVLNTYRFCHHSKSDDYRDPEEIKRWKANDPIQLLQRELPNEEFDKILSDVAQTVAEAVTFARESPFPTLVQKSLDEGFGS